MTSPLLLGCIGDDFTGSTDLANTLVRNGMRTVQLLGVPDDAIVPDADAIVIALKSRTSPVKDAIAESLAARRWLQRRGAKQLYFKYCSTFDSTDEGNIGPVASSRGSIRLTSGGRTACDSSTHPATSGQGPPTPP